MVNVRQHPRQVRFLTKGSPVRIDAELHWRMAGVTYSGDLDVFLGSIRPALKVHAKEYGIELKEAHIRDDLIETLIHEYLHFAVDDITIEEPLYKRGTVEEERIVERIAAEAAEEIREMPRLGNIGESAEVRKRLFEMREKTFLAEERSRDEISNR